MPTLTPQQQLDAAWAAATTPQQRAAAVQDVIAALPPLVDGEMRCPLRLPWGDWDVADHDSDGVAIAITRPALLSLGGSRLRCPIGQTCIRFDAGSSYARLEDGAIAFPGGVPQAGSIAVHVRAHGVRVSDLRTTYGDFGLVIDGRDEYDANAVMVRDVAIWGARVGVWIVGGDSSAGEFRGVEINGDGLTSEIGIQDDSFLGNVFTGVHIATTRHEAYIASEGTNCSALVGTYLEANCGYELPGGFADAVRSQARITWLGGGAVLNVDIGDRVGLQHSVIAFRRSLPNGGAVQVTIPDAGRNAAFSYERMTPAGLVEEGGALRWIDSGSLERVGLHVWTGSGYTGAYPVADDGLTMPLGYASSRNASPFEAIVNATGTIPGLPYAPFGFKVPKP